MSKPLVTVLMSVYNSEKYLAEAIESILNQTFTDFEFLIINDASTDSSRDIITSYNDSRIKLIENESNIGLTKSLNKGIELTQGKYIARMDADDISMPKRFEKQIAFMEKHPNIGVCGGWCSFINEKSIKLYGLWKTYKSNDEIKSGLIFNTQFCHSTILIRKQQIDKYNLRYDENMYYAQDYAFSIDCTLKKIESYNIQEMLVKYRTYRQINEEKNLGQKNTVLIYQKKYITKLFGIEQTEFESYRFILEKLYLNSLKEEKEIYELIDFLNKLVKSSNTHNSINNSILKSFLFNHIFHLFNDQVLEAIKKHYDSDFIVHYLITMCDNVKNSYSYKLGNFMTYIPRKIKKIVKKVIKK